MKKMLCLLIAGLMVSVIIIGCSTEKPWEAGDVAGLELVIVSAPDTTTDIFSGSSVSFSWSATGGSGVVAGYRWYLEPLEATWSTSSNYTTTTYENVLSEDDTTALDYIFHVEATDSDGDVATKTADFTVMAPADVDPDVTAPAVTITQGPADDSYVATGTSIAFAWTGDDGHGNDDMIEYQYAYPMMDDSVEWGMATNVVFANVVPTNPAMFYVRGRDQFDNVSAWDSIGFTIRDATVLYIDDYLWLDALGNPDMPKERDQKQFYRNALEGYAFAEWDIALQGYPDTADLVDAGTPIYSTIVFCADSEIGTTDGTPWYWLGDHDGYDGAAMRYHLELGGNLLLTGALAVLDMSNNYGDVVATDDFEFEWLGVDTVAWAYDYWYWFTWAMKDTLTELDLPDSMKIDVAKNGDQDDYAMEFPGLRNDDDVTTEVIFTWGPWVDPDDPPPPLGNPLGYIVSFDGAPQTANLAFDTYSMPPDAIRQTFRAILTVFGE